MEISEQATDDHHHNKEILFVEDLIWQILLSLPLVSVLRFKCVSKLWYSLISNPCFLRNHARQSHLRRDRLDPLMLSAGLLFCPGETHSISTEYSQYEILPQDQVHDTKPLLKTYFDHSLPAFKQKFSWCFLVESCNGLLLYRYENRNELGWKFQNEYIVCNPITNQYREVPIMDLLQTFEPEEVKEIYFTESPHIVFDPSISLSYKVIACLYHGNPCPHHAFYFYSADTNSWRLSTSFDDEDGYSLEWNTVMFNGVFYWLNHDVSICFDAVNENVWFLPLPPIPSDYSNRDVVYFGECNGRLRLIEEYISFDREDDGWKFPCSFDIMEMDIGSKIWTVKYRVNFEEGYDHLITDKMDPLNRGVVRVVHHYRTNKGEEAILLSVDYEKLVSFNLTTKTFGEEFTIPYIRDYQDFCVYSFTPTLFPLLT